MKYHLSIIAFVLFSVGALAQDSPLPASTVMKNAYAQAAREKKNVFLMFHASWCGWCHKMDTAINDDLCKNLFDNNYTIVHLDVMERKGKENLENPEGLEMLKKYHGDEQGIPFWLIFNPEGKLLADSRMRTDPSSLDGLRGDNIGCPTSAEEVAYFIELIKKTSHLDPSQLAVIANRFRQIK